MPLVLQQPVLRDRIAQAKHCEGLGDRRLHPDGEFGQRRVPVGQRAPGHERPRVRAMGRSRHRSAPASLHRAGRPSRVRSLNPLPSHVPGWIWLFVFWAATCSRCCATLLGSWGTRWDTPRGHWSKTTGVPRSCAGDPPAGGTGCIIRYENKIRSDLPADAQGGRRDEY